MRLLQGACIAVGPQNAARGHDGFNQSFLSAVHAV